MAPSSSARSAISEPRSVSDAFASWLTLRRIHRRQTAGYDFGLGKQEQILSLMVAVLLLVSAGFVIWKAATKLPEAGDGIGVLNAVAVAMVLFNLFANVAPIPPLMRALRENPSVIVRTQLRAKITKTVGSSIVVASVAVAQLGSNPMVSLWADRAGVAIVVLVTLRATYDLLRTALPDLLDRTLDEPLQHRINRVLAEHFEGYDSIECNGRSGAPDAVQGVVSAAEAAHASKLISTSPNQPASGRCGTLFMV